MANHVIATVSISTQEMSTSEKRGEHDRPIDPERSYLTVQQVNNIVRTWKKVEDGGDILRVGIKLFERLFEIAPGATQMFPKFAGVAKDELTNDPNFRNHASSVSQAVEVAVSSIDDLDGLFAILKDLGTVHTGLGIQDIHFVLVGQSLLWGLEQALGGDFTPDVKEAWTKFYSIVAEKMKEGLYEASCTRFGHDDSAGQS